MSTLSYSGRTFEEGVPVSRLVRVYSRDSGTLLASVMSDGSGYFTATWVGDWEAIFVVVLDADGGNQYNALVRDLKFPFES